ncbi:MAG: NAD(P)/FAD-dependent oxidoreductase [Actinomycetota bacterium]
MEHRPLPERVDAVVVGAGLAGLAAARVLHEAGRSVVVVEASDGVGGRVRTDVVNGFRLDRGFQVLLTAYPEVQRQLDVEALRLRAFLPGSLIWTGARLHAVGDPFRRPSMLLPSATAPIGSLPDKLRMAGVLGRARGAEPRALLRGADVSTATALRERGFGERIMQRFFRPLLGGIQLDADLTGSARMSDTILHCLAAGESVVPADGMQAIPDQMAARLPGGCIHLGSAVAEVHPGSVRLSDGGTVKATTVVVATEGPAAARLLRGAGHEVRDPGSRPVSCVWFDAPSAPIDHRLIVLDGVGTGPALNVAVMSNVAPEYVTDAAPEGHSLVAAACPGDHVGTDLIAEVRRQLGGWWGPQVRDWSVLRVDHIAHGQPDQQPPFAPKRQQVLGEGLFVCGDHRDTPSIQGAMFSGRRCGEAVVQVLAAG